MRVSVQVRLTTYQPLQTANELDTGRVHVYKQSRVEDLKGVYLFIYLFIYLFVYLFIYLQGVFKKKWPSSKI